MNKPTISAVDLFCGVGGLTHGLAKAGIDVRAGVDIEGDCRFAYESNNSAKFIEGDVASFSSSDLVGYFTPQSFRLLAGCAPCQPFSSYSNRYRKSTANVKHATRSRLDAESENWKLLRSFLRLVLEVKPELVTMENVVPLQAHSEFTDFVNGLTAAGYCVTHHIVRCADYGVPQKRRRLVLFASKYGPVAMTKSELSRRSTVEEWIGKLPKIEAGEIYRKDPLHRSGGLTEKNLKRIRASLPGGTWRDWDEDLLSDCHKESKGKSFSPVYGRMDWEKAPTITTQFFTYGTGRFGHPVQDRAISLREGALLQTFPRNYKFVKKSEEITFAKLGRWIGNAVPVNLGQAIGQSLVEHLRDSKRLS